MMGTDPHDPKKHKRDGGPGAASSAQSFEGLLASLSNWCLNLDTEEFARDLEMVLGAVGEFMDADRCYIFQLSDDGDYHHVTHLWIDERVDVDHDVVGVVVKDVFAWLNAMMLRHENIVINEQPDLPAEAQAELAYVQKVDIRSFLMCPMFSRDLVVGTIGLDIIGRQRTWTEEDIRRLRLVGEIMATAMLRLRKDREILRLQQELKDENRYLREEVSLATGHDEIVGDSEVMRSVLADAEQVAATDSTALILGETGTGKELVASKIHRLSARSGKPFVSINCGALPGTLIESELFGREKGAYTGALSRQIGRFEIADGSTLFLDEIGELPIEVQPKLLRVLESGEFERLGSSQTIKVDVRVIAATNRDLGEEVRRGNFRSDLFYRINVFPMSVPPLRDRPQDIPALVWHFVRQFEKSMGRRIERVHEQDLEALQAYAWPGNVRELRNAVEKAMIRARSGELRIETPVAFEDGAMESASLEEVERAHILRVLEKVKWRIRGQGGAAELLGLKPTTLESRMQRLGIQRH